MPAIKLTQCHRPLPRGLSMHHAEKNVEEPLIHASSGRVPWKSILFLIVMGVPILDPYLCSGALGIWFPWPRAGVIVPLLAQLENWRVCEPMARVCVRGGLLWSR